MTDVRLAKLKSMADRAASRIQTVRQAAPALDLGWTLVDRFRQLNGSVLAGHVAYRLFVWLAPFVLVLTGLLGAQASAEFDLTRFASDVGVSDEAARSVADQARTSMTTALAVGLPALALATVSLVRGCHYAYAQAWDLEIKPRKSIIRSSGATVIGATALAFLYLVLAAIQRSGLVLAFGGWVVSVALTAAVLLCLVWVLPRRTSKLWDLWPGPLVGAVGLAGLEVFAAVHLPDRIQGASAVYGSLGLAVALLFFQFMMAIVFIAMAFINSVWTDRNEIIAGRPWIVDPEALPRLARRPARWAVKRTDNP